MRVIVSPWQIEFPLPDVKTKRRIFSIHTGRMTLAEDVDLEEFVMAKDELSGADIKVELFIWLEFSWLSHKLVRGGYLH